MPHPVGNLIVNVPKVERQPIGTDLDILNLNPQFGSRPLTNIEMFYDPNRYGNFSADVSSEFIAAVVVPSRHPHWGTIPLAILNDDIAATSVCAALQEPYGEKGRYVTLSGGFVFHREVSPRGTLLYPDRYVLEVDSFHVLWELDKLQARHDLSQRGIWRVEIRGLNGGESIKIASFEGEYFRRKPVARA
jgi:hypothetical protein